MQSYLIELAECDNISVLNAKRLKLLEMSRMKLDYLINKCWKQQGEKNMRKSAVVYNKNRMSKHQNFSSHLQGDQCILNKKSYCPGLTKKRYQYCFSFFCHKMSDHSGIVSRIMVRFMDKNTWRQFGSVRCKIAWFTWSIKKRISMKLYELRGSGGNGSGLNSILLALFSGEICKSWPYEIEQCPVCGVVIVAVVMRLILTPERTVDVNKFVADCCIVYNVQELCLVFFCEYLHFFECLFLMLISKFEPVSWILHGWLSCFLCELLNCFRT